jgi:hypothetical protein
MSRFTFAVLSSQICIYKIGAQLWKSDLVLKNVSDEILNFGLKTVWSHFCDFCLLGLRCIFHGGGDFVKGLVL